MIENAPLLVASGIALVAGLVSFLSPCVLPLVPVYLASLAGPEIFDTEIKRRRLPIFLHSLSFVIGFSIVFSLWGAGAGWLGSVLGWLVAHRRWRDGFDQPAALVSVIDFLVVI